VSLSQASQCLSCQSGPGLGVLLPHLAGMVVERAEITGDRVQVRVRSGAGGAQCPGCGWWSGRVHSGYGRVLADTAAGGRRTAIRLQVRRFFCDNPACVAVTFAEQAGGLAGRHARRTALLAQLLTAVAVALAGRAGARLAAVLGVPVSRHTLIRLLMAVPVPDAGPVRVLGIDDFSLRRGRSYATLLVDMEAGVPVGVLPDREAATLETWLIAHPEVEVICRDRSGAYAEAARAAAPGASQVADRWHLWAGLCEYAGKTVALHKDCLAAPPEPARDQQDQDQQDQDQDQEREQEQGQQEQGQEREQEQEQERAGGVPAAMEAVIRSRHAAVHELRAAGSTQAQAAAALGLTSQLTGRYWRAATADRLLARGRPAPGLDPWKPYLRQGLRRGTPVRALHRQITELGYRGSLGSTHGYLSAFTLAAPARPPAPPRPRDVTALITSGPAALDPAGHARLTAIRARCPELDALTRHVARFAWILTGRHGDQLDTWIAAVDADPGQQHLHSFTTGIRQDYQAVRNGLTMTWNSGRVEGLNTRTKLLKRQMYGRAGLDLLTKRILLRT
jgi:transposase